MDLTNKALYQYDVDTYYGSIRGLFIEDVDKMNSFSQLNPTVHFGEVLGKHSEVEVEFKELNLKKIILYLENNISLQESLLLEPISVEDVYYEDYEDYLCYNSLGLWEYTYEVGTFQIKGRFIEKHGIVNTFLDYIQDFNFIETEKYYFYLNTGNFNLNLISEELEDIDSFKNNEKSEYDLNILTFPIHTLYNEYENLTKYENFFEFMEEHELR